MRSIRIIQKNNNKFEKQLRKPIGQDGIVVGKFLTKLNFDKSIWTISFLDIQPTDFVLEIGFGTGRIIKHIANSLTKGKIYGLDFSKIMVEEAKKVNKGRINKGTVIIDFGDINQSTYKDSFFNKIFAVNVFYFWEKPVQTLKEILRILKPNGKLALFIYHKNSQTDRSRSGIFKNYSGEEVIKLFNKAGFINSRFIENKFKNNERLGVCITGEKPF